MEQLRQVTVRRARPSDAERIAAFVNRAQPRGREVGVEAVLGRFGAVGFLLAEREGVLVGLMGWQVENLVARVTDFLILPASERLVVGRVLVEAMEQAARDLQCEVAVLFVPERSPPGLTAFWEAFGYRSQEVAALPKVWREATQEAHSVGESVLLKQLREGLVRHPL